MKLVTFARSMPPHGKGDTRLVSDEVAARLEADGAISEAVAWPAGAATGAPPRRPRRVVPVISRPQGVADRRIVRD